MKVSWKDWRDALIDIFFPGECPICEKGAYLDNGAFACLSCLDQLCWLNGARCKVCGKPMPVPVSIELTCSECRVEKPFFKAGRSMFKLDDRGRALIHSIKYGGSKRVLSDACHWIQRSDGFKNFIRNTVLIPVPLHRKKLNKRGFNQSLWIASEFAKVAGGRTVVYDCLERVHNTPSQTKLAKKERRSNVKNAFALKPDSCLKGFDEFVLVDDVFTTGATLGACAGVLVKAGYPNVKVATMGRG